MTDNLNGDDQPETPTRENTIDFQNYSLGFPPVIFRAYWFRGFLGKVITYDLPICQYRTVAPTNLTGVARLSPVVLW